MNWLRRIFYPQQPTVSNWTVLIVIVAAATGIAAVTSHLSLKFLKIKSTWGGSAHYGPKEIKARTILQCSSIAYSAIDWNQIASFVGGSIQTVGAPGSTPSEWEYFNDRLSDADRAFIVVAAADLNEDAVCDFRAEIVPLGQTIQDLRQSHADRQLFRTLLTQYPESLARKLFPTIGRSDGVMVGVRAKLQSLLGGAARADEGAAPIFDPARKSDVKEKITDWSEGRIQRQLLLMRAGVGRFRFEGPKKLALLRLLQKTDRRGEVVLVVLPSSPLFQKNFLSANIIEQFDNELADIQRQLPKVKVVRLDGLRSLEDDALYSDLVHMNMYGQVLATRAFLERLASASASK